MARVEPLLWAGLALAGWSVFLLDTGYLEPLPWTAGGFGVALLLMAALGAGLVSGWRRWKLLWLLAAALVGCVSLSGALWYGNPDYPDLNDVALGLFLLPVVIALGGLATHLPGRMRLLGGIVLAGPLVVVVWAGFRHLHPVDERPTDRFLIQWGDTKAYRGVRYGDSRRRLLSTLGKPDSSYFDQGYEYLVYGRDTFTVTGEDGVQEIEIKDPRAETSEGVGIRDNLGLVERRLTRGWGSQIGIDCRHNRRFEPECSSIVDGRLIVFTGDPIEAIDIL